MVLSDGVSSGNFCINNDHNRTHLLITRVGYEDTLISVENLYLKEVVLESRQYSIPEVNIIGELDNTIFETNAFDGWKV